MHDDKCVFCGLPPRMIELRLLEAALCGEDSAACSRCESHVESIRHSTLGRIDDEELLAALKVNLPLE
jgi:hypothetical protein